MRLTADDCKGLAPPTERLLAIIRLGVANGLSYHSSSMDEARSAHREASTEPRPSELHLQFEQVSVALQQLRHTQDSLQDLEKRLSDMTRECAAILDALQSLAVFLYRRWRYSTMARSPKRASCLSASSPCSLA